MNFLGNDRFSSRSSVSPDEEILIKKLFLTHDPDGRRLDSELLLCAMENIMCYTTSLDASVDATAKNDISNIEIIGSEELLGHTICKISREMVCKCSGEANLHARTMILFDLVGNFRWDAKVALILSAFATIYGEFWLIMKLYPHDPLAASVAMLKKLPVDLSKLKPLFKSLRLLIKTMVEVAKCIVKFEGLPLRHVELDNEALNTVKSCMCIAAYWVTKGTLACSTQIADLISLKSDQVYSDLTVIAAWQLSSLVYKLINIRNRLIREVDLCHQQLENKIYQKLSNIFKEAHVDNQEVLDILLALKDELPLKDSLSQAKLGVSQLKDKVVLLLVSKLELFPLEGLLLLVHQTYDHPDHKNLEGGYEMVWLPISFSDAWTDAQVQRFLFLSNSLPWYSVRNPWALNSAVLNYIKQEWNYRDDPLMIVLDSQGKVTNLDAIDMVFIWGARAHPFSSSREKELWEKENWTLQLLVNEIDPLLTSWVEEGKNICIYGGENMDWFKEFNAELKKIRSNGVQLEMVYVGSRTLSETLKNILSIIDSEMHCNVFSLVKIRFFWIRLESMRRSKLRLGQATNSDHVFEEVSALLDTEDEGWTVIGRGGIKADIVKLQGRKAMECFGKFSEWGENLTNTGFVDALKTFLQPPTLEGPCNHSSVVPYAEGLIEGTVICEKCKRTMKKYVVFE